MSIRIRGDRLSRKDLDGIFNEYHPRVFNYLYYRTLDRALADDLTSDVMVSIVRKFDTFDRKRGNLDAWVFRIARNVLFSHFRKQRTVVDIDNIAEGTFATEDDDAFDDKGAMVHGLLEVLTPEERELVFLKFWEELSNKEIAERLDMNPSTVSTQLWRANEKMRKAMPRD